MARLLICGGLVMNLFQVKYGDKMIVLLAALVYLALC